MSATAITTAITILGHVLRTTHVAALSLLFGSLLFRLALGSVAPRLVRLSCAISVASGLAWLTVQAALFAGADGIGTWLAAIPPAAGGTRFGQVMLLRLALLTPVWWLGGGARSGVAVLAFSGCALALQPFLGHAGAAGEPWLVLAAIMHVLGAGAWIGALPALALALRGADPATATRLAWRFGVVGMAGVAAILLGGAGQAWEFAGDPPAWIGTPYGLLLLAKLVLLAVLLGIAARNRFILTPRLDASLPARQALWRMVLAEILLGLLVLGLAAVLAGQIPGAHAQPDWPFPWRPSLAVLAEPELRQEVGLALLGLGGGLLCGAVLLVGFRRRFAAAMLTLAGLVWAWPTAPLLLVPAWPTSFWQATAPTEADRVRGAALFTARCAGCHGGGGRGDGARASSLDLPPADLTAEHLLEHTDGELHWWITHGLPSPRGGLVMPAQADLAADDVWALIAHVHALNPYAALYRRDGAVHRH